MFESMNQDGEGPLDCVDAFAILRRIMRPECIEDIYNPVGGMDHDGIDGLIDLPGVNPGLDLALFRDEGEPLGFDEVYVGAEV